MSKEIKFGFIEDDNNKIKFVKIPKKYYKYIENREQLCFENMKKLEKDLEWKKELEIKAITIQATTILQKKEKEFKSKLKVLEKALELMSKSFWGTNSTMKFFDTGIQVNSQAELLEYFKSRAKEMMKSE